MSQSEERRQFAETLLAGQHSPKAIAAEFLTGPDDPVDLTGKTPAELEDLRGSRVLLTPAIASYLASGDSLTTDTLDNAEIALEKHYGIQPPFYITSRRLGASGSTLEADCFFLDREA